MKSVLIGISEDQQREGFWGGKAETEVLLGSFISFDILASASTRSRPILGLDHIRDLEIFGIDLAGLFGCTNDVMALILQIVLLDNWKKEAEVTRQLSMVELVKRGSKVEERLREKIEELESIATTEFVSLLDSDHARSASQIEISRIFALSALTYLHVVMSGAHPQLPEIAENVSRTIVALQHLTDPKLLRSLVWPFCVTGCLAQEEQHSLIRDLVSKAEITSLTIGTCFKAFEIIQECWEVRRTCVYNSDWVFVMNKWGHNVLLV